MKAKETMNNDEVCVSVPKIGIIEMENPGAESGRIQLYSVNFVFFLLFIHHLNRHVLRIYYMQITTLGARKRTVNEVRRTLPSQSSH